MSKNETSTFFTFCREQRDILPPSVAASLDHFLARVSTIKKEELLKQIGFDSAEEGIAYRKAQNMTQADRNLFLHSFSEKLIVFEKDAQVSDIDKLQTYYVVSRYLRHIYTGYETVFKGMVRVANPPLEALLYHDHSGVVDCTFNNDILRRIGARNKN
jgi:hypothetical protein